MAANLIIIISAFILYGSKEIAGLHNNTGSTTKHRTQINEMSESLIII
jgi:hypothetical protein